MAAGGIILCGICGCQEDAAVMVAGQQPEMTAWYSYNGDIEMSKDKVMANVKKPDPDDAKGKVGLGGRFPTQIDAFHEYSLVTLSGGANDGHGFGASGTRSYYPDKLSKNGAKLKRTVRDQSAKCSGHPKVGAIGMSINEGFITFMLKGGTKPGGDYLAWKQYVPLLQAMLGISARGKEPGMRGVGITTQITVNASLTISVTGYSKRAKGMIGETHSINSPVIFSAKNGKITLHLPDDARKDGR